MLGSSLTYLHLGIANPAQGATGYIVTAVRPFTQVSPRHVWTVIPPRLTPLAPPENDR